MANKISALTRRAKFFRLSTSGISLFASSILWACAASAADDHAASPPNDDAKNRALLKRLELMEQRVEFLESQLKRRNTAAQAAPAAQNAATPAQSTEITGTAKPDGKPDAERGPDQVPATAANKPGSPAPAKASLPIAAKPDPWIGDKPILGVLDSPVQSLAIGAYGEIYFGSVQNPAAGGQWQNSFDARRFVLLPTYDITDNIIFNAEIEFEHAGIGFDNDDKLHGTAEIEQLWIDFKIVDQINWRAPGVDLVPIGYINQHHEPTQFYSVLRPELYNGLIPSTWKVPSTSVYGTIVDGVKYQLMLAMSNEDFGDSVDLISDARTVPPYPIPYFPGVDGLNALTFSNPPLGDFGQLINSLAVTGRVDFTPPSVPGLAWSVSGYFSPNIEP